MNTVLLYITLAFFVIVVATIVVMLIGAAQSRANADAETEHRRGERNPPTAPTRQHRLG